MTRLICFLILLAPGSALGEEKSFMDQMRHMDAQVFDAFNQCEDKAQLKKHESFFTRSVEFYHDNGGVTWDRQTMLANTEKYACGNYTRELIAESFHAYPIKDFGAITEGIHQFCQTGTGKCDGKAKFVMVWQNLNGNWKVSRVISYAHAKT